MDNLTAAVQPKIDVEIVKGKSTEEVAKCCEVLSSAALILKTPLKIGHSIWI
jgi:ornithine cyclodeaminase/alanine dehydrogenase